MKQTEAELVFLKEYLIQGSMEWLVDLTLYNKLMKVISRYSNPENCKGMLGETYFNYCITQQLRERGLKFNLKSTPNSYRGFPQYPRAKGIDLYLRIVDKDNKVYRCFIEVSNWAKYHTINDYIFHNRIANKYDKWDKLDRNIHILAINHRNVKLIKDRCNEKNILIIPMREHITPDFLNRIKEEVY